MKTIAIISRKGGAGKTTIATHLAAEAAANNKACVLFDLDPQATAEVWATRRENKNMPFVKGAKAPMLASLLKQAQEQKADLIILDTAPHDDSSAAEAASLADFIIIPCRPSSFDLDAISASIRLGKTSDKPCYVLINAAPAQGVETQRAKAALERGGVKVCPVILHQRKSFTSHMPAGQTAAEFEPSGKAAEEIRALYKWIVKHIAL